MCYSYLLNDFLNLLFPVECISCEKVIESRKSIICSNCFNDILKTDYHAYPRTNRFWALLNNYVSVEYALSLFTFRKGDVVQKLLYAMKYGNHPEVGTHIGIVYGIMIKQTRLSGVFDAIIPVPLHKKKLQKRGYNQSEMFAFGLSSVLDIPVDTTTIIRTVNNSSQTNKSSNDRFASTNGIFMAVHNNYPLIWEHVLVVDDIVTTGATVTSCVKTIQTVSNCKVSVASIACAV